MPGWSQKEVAEGSGRAENMADKGRVPVGSHTARARELVDVVTLVEFGA